MEDKYFYIIILMMLFTLVMLGFQLAYKQGFGRGVYSVCGNLTAYTKDFGKTFYCDEAIDKSFHPFIDTSINFSDSLGDRR